MTQFLGNLTTYEMRLPKGKSNVREATFKADKCKEENEDTCSCSDEEEAKFVRRLDKGMGKYKGKLPFKCFNCGRVGHYASKCPHKKTENHPQEAKKTKINKWQKGKRVNRKSFYAQQDSNAFESSDEFSNEEGTSEFVLMAKEESEGFLLEDEEEGELDLEGELRSALEEIDRLKLKRRKHKNILLKCVKEVPNSEDLIQLKGELEEDKKVEDILLKKTKDNHQEQEKLEEEVVRLRKKIENTQRELSKNTPQMTSTEQLDMILNAQRSPLIKAGIGYEAETSTSKARDNKKIIFVKAIKNSETTQQIPTEEEVNKNMSCKETNRIRQQHERTENEKMK